MNNVYRIQEWTKYTELKNQQSTRNYRVKKYTELRNENNIQN